METFGERLRRIRLAAGLSVNQFAKLVGKDPGGISRIENGKRLVGSTPAYPDLVRWAGVLKVSVEELGGEVGVRQVAEAPAPYITDEALVLRFGGTPVTEEELTPEIEEFAASALRGKGNLIPQNYDDMRRKPQPRKKKPEAHIFKVRISGDCMRETVQDGEIVWFDTWLPREAPALVMAVKDDHESHVKRLVMRDGEPWLESDDGWSTPLDEHWRVTAVAFTAQRAIIGGH